MEHFAWTEDTNRPRFGDDERYNRPYEFACQQLIKKSGELILESLYRLNKFPRDNSFWHNTNRRPTVYKLPEFCNLILQQDKNDQLALWTMAAIALLWGANGFGRYYWKRLYELKCVELKTIINAGLYYHLNIGDGAPELAELIIEIDAREETKKILQEYIKFDSELIFEWSGNVLKNLQDE